MITSIDITVDYGLMKIFTGYYRHIHKREKLKIWAEESKKIECMGRCLKQYIGSYFIEGNLTSAKYENMLRNQILPAIQAIIG